MAQRDPMSPGGPRPGADPAAPLPPTPSSVLDGDGRPRYGRYEGPLPPVDLSRRTGRRALDGLRHKRWFYLLVATRREVCAAAIVDVGYASNAFAFAATVERGLIGQVSALGLPGLTRVGDRPEEGCDARFTSPTLRVSLRRPGGASAYHLQVESRALSIDAVVETRPAAGRPAPPPLSAIVDLARLGGGVNVTQKRALCRAAGVLRAGRETLPLDDALGGLDYTQGILPRRTAWRWAFLLGRATDGTPVGLNLVQGWNGAAECAAWAAGDLVPLPEAQIQGDLENPLVPWRVTTPGGAVELAFQPVGLHAEHRNLLLVRSRYVQPVGRYRGALRLPGRAPLQLDDVLGVTEDQDVLW